jgi:hypothetical protein
MALPDALELQWLVTARAAFLDGVGGELEQDLTREGVVLRCSGSSRYASSPRSTSPAMPDSEIWIALARSSAVGAFCFAIATTVLGLQAHNLAHDARPRQSPAGRGSADMRVAQRSQGSS